MKDKEEASSEVTRRSFLRTGVGTAGMALAAQLSMPAQQAHPAPDDKTSPGSERRTASKSSSFIELLRVPDQVHAFSHFEKNLPRDEQALVRGGETWSGKGMAVETRLQPDELVVTLESPADPVSLLHLRWRADVKRNLMVLGDAWERSYGELGWRNLIPERVMPWYFVTTDGSASHGYGVKTNAAALCFWQLDSQGVSLWLNVTNGGDGVVLGARKLMVASVISRRGAAGEDAIESARQLCRKMCARSSRPNVPIFGANDWDYSYGQSTAETILRDTDFFAELAPAQGPRPFSVIDGGWSDGTPAWPDMGRLAAEIRRRKVRPGLWIRPLEAPQGSAQNLLLSTRRFGERKERASELAYDPTHPEAREKIGDKMRQAVGWGYEMVKHDFSTYDLLGQWGFEMGPQPSVPGWSLYDRTRTNAEVIADLYALLRAAAGDAVLLDGCNTIGHLGQGVFDLQRAGDDTSGHQWERTRRMGVNTLAFRLPQHESFFVVDPDLVGITDAVPWELNRQWLDLVAHTGTATLVSVAPSQRGPEQRAALREAFQMAVARGTGLRPVDWMENSTPELWRAASSRTAGIKDKQYQWSGQVGASPFLSA